MNYLKLRSGFGIDKLLEEGITAIEIKIWLWDWNKNNELKMLRVCIVC